jgi:transposase
VHSYRNTQGKPTHKAIANLGDLPKQTEINLSLALKASSRGQAIIIAPNTKGFCDSIVANLRFLDIVVLLTLWRSWAFEKYLAELFDDPTSLVRTEQVIAALVIQRCVAPRSKWFAQQWFPTTALPEWMHISPEHFNNNRIHRALSHLYQKDTEIQRRLYDLYAQKGTSLYMTFMDVTNTFFEGQGCDMAEHTLTKEGIHNKRAIGIVLLANQLGYPLRWHVVSGKTKDHHAMGAMMQTLAEVSWMKEVPLVVDRAMGRLQTLQMMLQLNVHFVTAVPVNSIETHTKKVPYTLFSDVLLHPSEEKYQENIKRVSSIATRGQMKPVDEHLFVLDLGTTDLTRLKSHKKNGGARRLVSLKQKLHLSREIQRKLDSGEYKNLKAAAQTCNVSYASILEILKWGCLADDIQEEILSLSDEKGFRFTWKELRPLTKEQDGQKQRALFDAWMKHKKSDETNTDSDGEMIHRTVRLVAYFNPQMFVDQRLRAEEHLQELYRFVENLNQELLQAKKSRKEELTRRKVHRELEKKNVLHAFDVISSSTKIKSTKGKTIQTVQCQITLKEDVWKRLRRYDGFVLLVVAPELKQSAKDIALMYRAKDTIEKDFEKIKSSIKIRPVFHFTDPKVQAHVSVCMLSLALERILEQELKKARMSLSATAFFDVVGTCHLNQVKRLSDGQMIYSITKANTAQHELLAALDMLHLVDDTQVSAALQPRVMPT